MAAKNQFNIHTTYYESFLALSVRVDRHQLMMETPSSSQAPVLRYRDITFTTEYLKESLSAVCPLLEVHNVARVRQGATLPLVEVDFTDEKALERFCKSISDGMLTVSIITRRYEYAGNASRRVQKVIYLRQNCMLNSGAFSQCMHDSLAVSILQSSLSSDNKASGT